MSASLWTPGLYMERLEVQKHLIPLEFDHKVVRFGVLAPKPRIQKDCLKTSIEQLWGNITQTHTQMQIYI